MTDRDFPECVPVVRDLRAFHFGRYREPPEAEASQPEPAEREEKPLRQPATAYSAKPKAQAKPAKERRISSDEVFQRGRAIFKRLESGKTVAEIAAEDGCSLKSVYQRLFNAGLTVPRKLCVGCGVTLNTANAQRCKECGRAYRLIENARMMRENWAARKGATA